MTDEQIKAALAQITAILNKNGITTDAELLTLVKASKKLELNGWVLNFRQTFKLLYDVEPKATQKIDQVIQAINEMVFSGSQDILSLNEFVSQYHAKIINFGGARIKALVNLVQSITEKAAATLDTSTLPSSSVPSSSTTAPHTPVGRSDLETIKQDLIKAGALMPQPRRDADRQGHGRSGYSYEILLDAILAMQANPSLTLLGAMRQILNISDNPLQGMFVQNGITACMQHRQVGVSFRHLLTIERQHALATLHADLVALGAQRPNRTPNSIHTRTSGSRENNWALEVIVAMQESPDLSLSAAIAALRMRREHIWPGFPEGLAFDALQFVDAVLYPASTVASSNTQTQTTSPSSSTSSPSSSSMALKPQRSAEHELAELKRIKGTFAQRAGLETHAVSPSTPSPSASSTSTAVNRTQSPARTNTASSLKPVPTSFIDAFISSTEPLIQELGESLRQQPAQTITDVIKTVATKEAQAQNPGLEHESEDIQAFFTDSVAEEIKRSLGSIYQQLTAFQAPTAIISPSLNRPTGVSPASPTTASTPAPLALSARSASTQPSPHPAPQPTDSSIMASPAASLFGTRISTLTQPSAATPVSAPVSQNPPDEYICPITQELMKDPVIAMDGHSYERSAIENWLEKRASSPMTNVEMQKTLIPNINLRNTIQKWVEAQQLASTSTSIASKGL